MNRPCRSNIIHDNHYVPEAMLKRWSLDGTNTSAYRILVPDGRVPEWESCGIRSLAYQRDLYTYFEGGKELDEFERWLNEEYEHRGLEAIDRLISGKKLSSDDWDSMILLVAVQDVRTPLSYLEMMNHWQQELPALLKRVLNDSSEQLEEASEKGVRLTGLPENEFSDVFKVTVEPPSDPSSDKIIIEAKVTAGRLLWIHAMRHLLTGVAKLMCGYRWSVAEPYGDAEWPLTDHPVLRLNIYGKGRYDFKGGWGSPGTVIMMPVSPKHLLCVQVGQKLPNRIIFSSDDTIAIQRFLVERAHRWVFATQPEEWVTKVRPRMVGREMFEAEKRAWGEFHQGQQQSERSP